MRHRAQRALDTRARHYHDVLIVDTAGRLAIDEAMMEEIRELHAALAAGRDACSWSTRCRARTRSTSRKAFDEALPLTGVVLTKLDGDARGGAALSVRHVTGKPIKFVGVGEKLDGLEPFHPDRMASRILGMGDVLVAGRGGAAARSTRGSREAREEVQDGQGLRPGGLQGSSCSRCARWAGVARLLDKLPGAARADGAGRARLDEKTGRGASRASSTR